MTYTQSFGVMTVQCAWCNKIMDFVKCIPSQDGEVSHGLCMVCYPSVVGEYMEATK